MAEWNPSSTALKGLEWGPTVAGGVVLDSITKSAVMSVRQTTAQAIGTARVWVGAIPTRGGVYAVEIYDGETCVPANLQTLTARPDGDEFSVGLGSGNSRNQASGVTNIYTSIDESTLDVADYIWWPGCTANQLGGVIGSVACGGYVGSLGWPSLVGKRILAVRLHAVVARSSAQVVTAVIGFTDLDAEPDYVGYTGTPNDTTSPSLFVATFLANPRTGLQWAAADPATFLWWAGSTADPASAVYVYQAWAEIDVADENRLAIGVLDDTFSGLTPNAWNPVTLLTPTGGTWTKDAAGWHTAVVRRSTSVGSMVVSTLAAGEHPYPAEGWKPTLAPSNGAATAMGTVKPETYGLIFRTTAPAESVDSQPYATQVAALVFTGQDAEQELSDLAVANYSGARAWVKSNDATQPLLVKVKRRSDNVQMGQTITVTKAEADAFDAAGSGWREAAVQMATGFTAAVATQYYVEFSSSAAGTGTDYWSVLALDTGNQGNGATYGGATDRAVVNGSEADRYELLVTLWSLPTAPAGLTAAIDTQEMPEWTADDSEGCLPLIIEFVHLSWTGTALGVLFDHYELQRSDDAGSTWAPIGEISQEATVTFDDYETQRGVAARYRLRVWRSDDARSDWTTVVVAPACAPVRCELLFTTNADPTLNCAYNRQGPDAMEFEFLDAEEVVFQKIYGRDYQVAFLGTERRGVRFSVPLIVNAVRTPTVTNEGLPLFDAIRELSTADVPYVCVLDHHGNRWFAELQVSGGSHAEVGKVYIGQIVVTEVSGEPTPVEVI